MKLPKPIDQFESQYLKKFGHWGHTVERYALGLLFFWFGALKLAGETSATSIVAKSVYWWDPSWVVPALGVWEVIMGLCLLSPKTLRAALLLFAIRLPGTFFALIYHWEECFDGSLWIPTIQGQYLLKELALVGAALIIGSTISEESSQPTT